MSTVATGMVSNERIRWAKSNDGTIYLVNGIDRPQAWNGIAAATRNMGISSPSSAPTLALGAAGNLTGDYYYYTAFLNSVTGEYSGLSPLSAVITAAAKKVTVTRVSTTTDTQVDKWVIFRNTAGETTTFYKVTEVAYGTTTYDDNTSDVALGAAEVAEDHTEPDDSKPFIENFNGRMFLYGSRIESTGTIQKTSASASITGTGTNFRQSHVGQRIKIGTEQVEYTILSVTDSTHLTLTTNYSGSSTSGNLFKIYPIRRSDIAWSSASSNEGFAIADSAGIYPNDGDIPTGMKVIGTVLALFKRTKSYRFTFDGDPNPVTGNGQVSRALSSRGLVNNECCVVVADSAFCLDSLGVYQFDGATQEVSIDAAIRRYFHPDDAVDTSLIVKRQYSSTWHAVYEPWTNTVWFFVTTGSDTLPKTAFIFHRENSIWTTHKFQQAITCSATEIDSNGILTAFVGDENGCMWSLSGLRQSEGVFSGTRSGTATSGTSSTLTQTGASFYTANNGLTGVPVKIIAGTGAGQERIISSNTSTVLTVSVNWSVTPDATSQYIVGYIESTWRYKWTRFDQKYSGIISKVVAYFDPGAANEVFMFRVFKDYSLTPVTDWLPVGNNYDNISIDNDSNGWIKIYPYGSIGRAELCAGQPFDSAIAIEFSMLDSNNPPTVVGFDMIGEISYTQPRQRNV